jgi:hypothetical protein
MVSLASVHAVDLPGLKQGARAQACLNWDPFAPFVFGAPGSGTQDPGPVRCHLVDPSCRSSLRRLLRCSSQGPTCLPRFMASRIVYDEIGIERACKWLKWPSTALWCLDIADTLCNCIRGAKIWSNIRSIRMLVASRCREMASIRAFSRWHDCRRATPPLVDGSRQKGIGREGLADRVGSARLNQGGLTGI